MFWRLVPKEIFAIVSGENERLRREHNDLRAQNHALAILIGYAFHDPENMPSPGGEAAKTSETSSAADDARVRGFFMALAMRNST